MSPPPSSSSRRMASGGEPIDERIRSISWSMEIVPPSQPACSWSQHHRFFPSLHPAFQLLKPAAQSYGSEVVVAAASWRTFELADPRRLLPWLLAAVPADAAAVGAAVVGAAVVDALDSEAVAVSVSVDGKGKVYVVVRSRVSVSVMVVVVSVAVVVVVCLVVFLVVFLVVGAAVEVAVEVASRCTTSSATVARSLATLGASSTGTSSCAGIAALSSS
mmetsp:Transcript_50523/g.131289  ORF Transcript_50523/g.131289 Transcript_50523/m.131289 type:complete len:218 (-) Transcript_50523:255-908(-)